LIPNDAPRDLAEAYDHYTPILVRSAGAMARKGMDVTPDECLELVHDFYADDFSRVLDTFKPSRGTFARYLSGAFKRFAIQKIKRNARYAELFVPLDDALDQPAPEPVDESSQEEPSDERPPEPTHAERLVQALPRLPPEFREILEARLAGCASERELAKRFGLSRFATRQRLAEAIGRAAVAVGHDETIGADLRPFAVRLWRDDIPLMQVAKEFNLSRHEAHERYCELVRSLLGAATATLETVPRPWPRKEAIHG